MKLSKEELLKKMKDETKPIPGLEDTDLRYAGNENMGYFPCMGNGSIVVGPGGSPMILPSITHLQVWALGQAGQGSRIVIPNLEIQPN